MTTFTRTLTRAALLAASTLTVLSALPAQADEADIRKTLAERFPGLKPDEVRSTPMAGLWEIRFGDDIAYSDSKGNYLIQGSLIDTATKRNLTQDRVDKLTAIDFSSLPLKDAIVWKNGNGKRRIAVFADPNCGYCKKLEKDLVNVKDLTVYTFVIPILGGDSTDKSRSIWCAKDNTTAWRNWMVDGTAPTKAMGKCDDSAISRNRALAEKLRVNGTPAIFFEDGSRAPGAIPAAELERRLSGKAAG
jgi:thiol:disulfide interchange protein DsbC